MVPKYDGLWTAGTDFVTCGIVTNPQLTAWEPAGEGTVSGECAVVVKIDEIQNLFLTPSGSSMTVADLTQNFVTYVNAIDNDLIALDIPEDSDLRRGLSDFTANIDNGGTCENDTLTEVDQIFSILDVAEEVNQGASDYENLNLLSYDDVSSASDTTVSLPDFSIVLPSPGLVPITVTFSCNNSSSLDARLIYSDGAGGYVPYYSGADAAINTTFTTLKDLNTDASSNPKPNVAGDEIISFKELLCME